MFLGITAPQVERKGAGGNCIQGANYQWYSIVLSGGSGDMLPQESFFGHNYTTVHLPIDWVGGSCQVMVLRGGECGGLTVLSKLIALCTQFYNYYLHACINLTSGFSHFLSCHYLSCVSYYSKTSEQRTHWGRASCPL